MCKKILFTGNSRNKEIQGDKIAGLTEKGQGRRLWRTEEDMHAKEQEVEKQGKENIKEV